MTDEVTPHHYCPSVMHMGDCHYCGNREDVPWHFGFEAKPAELPTAADILNWSPVWPTPEHRKTYDEVWAEHERGLFSDGFMWELARLDEVFKRYVTKKGLRPL